MSERLANMLRYDPLAEAEDLVGEGPLSDALGFVLMRENAESKRIMLTEMGDSVYADDAEKYISILVDEGFEKIYEEEFDSPSSKKKENLYCFLNFDLGFLIRFDTWNGRVNSSTVYFNLEIPDGRSHFDTYTEYGFCLSGHMHERLDKRIWIGYSFGDEGIRHQINSIKKMFNPIVPWIESPIVWILNHAEKTTDEDFYDITRKKINSFSDEAKFVLGLD